MPSLLPVGGMEWQSGLPRLPSTLTSACLGHSPAATYSQLSLSPMSVGDPSRQPGLPRMSSGFAVGSAPFMSQHGVGDPSWQPGLPRMSTGFAVGSTPFMSQHASALSFVLICTFCLAGQFRFGTRRCFLLRVGGMEWQSGLPRLPSTLTPVCLGHSPAAAYSQLFLLSPIGVGDPSWQPGLPRMSTGFAVGSTPFMSQHASALKLY